jgi:hypothetical protein
MKQSDIAAVIERDLLRVDARPPNNTVQCFSCGYGMTYRRSRFCSDRCREWFDVNNPGLAQEWLERKRAAWRVIAGPPGTVGTEYYNPGLRSTKAGCLIDCAHCGQEFDSKGLRCCSRDCEQSYRERQHNLAVMAEVGVEPTAKRQCQTCGARIPKWRKGRKVSSATRFCSRKCARRHKTPEMLEMDSKRLKSARK